MPDDQHRQADINACINLCNKTPSCESINFFYGSTKWCTLYSERENPPAMDSTGFSSPVIAAVPKIAPGDRFTAADGCPGSDGKTKTLGAISWKISCNKYYGGATVKLTDEPNMQACAAACAANPICEVADYYYEGGANKLKCHQKGTGSWKEIPPNGGVAGLGSLTPTVNPQITNATPLQDSDTCPGIDQKYKKIADRVHKVWCGRAVQGAAVREPYTTQTSRAACMAACTSAADMKTATMAMNWSEKNKWCQCKAVKEDPPSYVNADWWTAVLV